MAISLSSIARNKVKAPRILVHGLPGVGKTTVATDAENPIVIQTEDGLGAIDVPAFPLAKSFADVMEALTALYSEDHEYQSLVVDSLDWLEPLVWRAVCEEHNWKSIEDAGYGKGYVEALTLWRKFFQAITALRDDKGMTIIMIAHSENKRIEDPTMPAYDRVDIKMHKRAAALAEEYCDCIFLARMQTHTVTEDKGFNAKRTRATTSGAREILTVGAPAYLAKNRYGLPPVLPLTWQAIREAMTQATSAAPAATQPQEVN